MSNAVGLLLRRSRQRRRDTLILPEVEHDSLPFLALALDAHEEGGVGAERGVVGVVHVDVEAPHEGTGDLLFRSLRHLHDGPAIYGHHPLVTQLQRLAGAQTGHLVR